MSLIHLNFDIETLGHRDSTVVTTLACVPFSFEDDLTYDDHVLNGFYVKFNIEEQLKVYKRTTCEETLAWWKQQTPEAKAHSIIPSKDDSSLVDGLNALR